ncbi:MAG: hypothetical protein LLG06_05930 [Desulfobacteraceae bacterium]|nr:hypothetical protein [Desulfobacteraceae bacterium]
MADNNVCPIHGEVVKRYDEFLAEQRITNQALFAKLNAISNRLWWVLGGIGVLSFLILAIATLFGGYFKR